MRRTHEENVGGPVVVVVVVFFADGIRFRHCRRFGLGCVVCTLAAAATGVPREVTEDDTRLVTCGRRVSTRRNDVSVLYIYSFKTKRKNIIYIRTVGENL